MVAYRLPEAELTELFTGLVVESLAVKQDFGTTTIGCRQCGETLSVGDAVAVALTCYEDHSWEIEGVYCTDHGVDSVAETMGIRAENQAVVGATLESAGYLPPDGNFEPDALTLGAVDVLDYSPTADGY
jgi:hypothetical protein